MTNRRKIEASIGISVAAATLTCFAFIVYAVSAALQPSRWSVWMTLLAPLVVVAVGVAALVCIRFFWPTMSSRALGLLPAWVRRWGVLLALAVVLVANLLLWIVFGFDHAFGYAMASLGLVFMGAYVGAPAGALAAYLASRALALESVHADPMAQAWAFNRFKLHRLNFWALVVFVLGFVCLPKLDMPPDRFGLPIYSMLSIALLVGLIWAAVASANLHRLVKRGRPAIPAA